VAPEGAADFGENCVVIAEKWLAELGFAGRGSRNIEIGFVGRRRVGITIIGSRDATARSKA
jgi:hypothetical protein